MQANDLFNLTLVNSKEEVDQINKQFYGRFNYPWPPSILPVYPEGMAEPFLNQDIGNWSHDRVPRKPKIWVAGCGTNQALLTALKFPQAEVLGTDISVQSLNACRMKAMQTGVDNLRLEEKSLNEIDYKEEFDYIICTGVVHHNADPEFTLRNIAGALKRNGVLEFMVYNYYHRLITTACQKAIREFYPVHAAIDLELELSIMKSLVSDFHYQNPMGDYVRAHSNFPEAYIADNLLQPVEYSYTIRSLEKLTDLCNLEFLLPCTNQFDATSDTLSWNMKWEDRKLRDRYNELPDIQRWQISNLLMFNDSPNLWFYFQRKDADHKRKTEQEVCEEFLDTKFRKNQFYLKHYEINREGNYILNEKLISYPQPENIRDPLIRKLLEAITPNQKMKDIFRRLDWKPSFYNVNQARARLSTLEFPYLLAE
jgi:SAM-dependent methyltransferase